MNDNINRRDVLIGAAAACCATVVPFATADPEPSEPHSPKDLARIFVWRDGEAAPQQCRMQDIKQGEMFGIENSNGTSFVFVTATGQPYLRKDGIWMIQCVENHSRWPLT